MGVCCNESKTHSGLSFGSVMKVNRVESPGAELNNFSKQVSVVPRREWSLSTEEAQVNKAQRLSYSSMYIFSLPLLSLVPQHVIL